MLGEALYAVGEAIRDSEAGSPHPASPRRFRSPTRNAGTHEISSDLLSRSGTAVGACQGPLSEISAYCSGAPAEQSLEVLAIASDGASGRALTEHGPCLIGGTVTLDDVSFITEIAIHIAEKTPLRLTDAELSMCRGATGGMTGKTRRRVCSGEQRLLRVIRRCRPSATCPATNRRGSWRLIAVMVAVGGGRAPPPLRCYP